LLGFDYGKKDNPNKPVKASKKVEIKDQEGVDFSFYFSEKYNFIHEKRKVSVPQ
jgi:hypothetical protein